MIAITRTRLVTATLLATAALIGGHAFAAGRDKAAQRVPLPRPNPFAAAKSNLPENPPTKRANHAMGPTLASAIPMQMMTLHGPSTVDEPDIERPSPPLSYAPVAPPSGSDVEVVKEALAFARRGKLDEATERQAQVRDTGAQKLIEWTTLRSDAAQPGFARYAAFVQANPDWPSVGMLRRRAEAQLWQERQDAGTVLAYFAKQKPISLRGRLAMARALLARGDQAGAQNYVRVAWQDDAISADMEADVLESFGTLLTRDDHRIRMDRRLYAEDFESALRTAKRLGGTALALAQARIAVHRKAGNAGALLEAVPNAARSDTGYQFARVQYLRRNDRIGEAAQALMAATSDADEIGDTNLWWLERRMIARQLLDADNPQAAYRIVRGAAEPEKENYRVEKSFMAGWLALRFLNDPNTAMRHFAEIPKVTSHPIGLARASYWMGRAAEAAGRGSDAQRNYEAAARHSTTYYGQLARARLGHRDISLRRPPTSGAAHAAARNSEMVRAVELLYATKNRDLVIPFVADAERMDAGAMSAIAETAARQDDARAMLLIGKAALARGLAFDQVAFPNIGIPAFASVGPTAERSLVYSIARQESAFNQRTVSIAKAMGLMQVTPSAGRTIAKRFGVTFQEKRLLSDPVYNTQLGAAEIATLVDGYDGNYAMAFAAYNAGRGRVRQWVERYGDPRDPKVDPVDWVERIPFGETRNYVQRVMENMQCYRARFGGSATLTVEAALRGNRSVDGGRPSAASKAAAAESDPRDGDGTHSASEENVD